MTRHQREILSALLDRYEASSTYAGTNKVTQSFYIAPEKIWRAYTDHFTDVDEIRQFEREVRELEAYGLIRIISKASEMKKLVAIPERFPDYYRLLDRIESKEERRREIALYRSYLGQNAVMDAFCFEQIRLLEEGKAAHYRKDRAVHYLALLERILRNERDLYERELSAEVLHDTKAFAGYRKGICEILRTYELHEDIQDIIEAETDARTMQAILLELHNIYANPNYVYCKGHVLLEMKSGKSIELSEGDAVALSSDFIDDIASIRLPGEASAVLTIENLTSFHRVSDHGRLCIYLGGYHNERKRRFLRKITAEHDIRWRHFGDIDPDGFQILEHLKRRTGLPFQSYGMGIEELRKYQQFGKSLTDHDRKRAHTLMGKGLYIEVLAYMLQIDRKLEQEMIGLTEVSC